MRQCCPLCFADHCSEERPDCQARAEQVRSLYAAANGPGEPRTIVVPPTVLARDTPRGTQGGRDG